MKGGTGAPPSGPHSAASAPGPRAAGGPDLQGEELGRQGAGQRTSPGPWQTELPLFPSKPPGFPAQSGGWAEPFSAQSPGPSPEPPARGRPAPAWEGQTEGQGGRGLRGAPPPPPEQGACEGPGHLEPQRRMSWPESIAGVNRSRVSPRWVFRGPRLLCSPREIGGPPRAPTRAALSSAWGRGAHPLSCPPVFTPQGLPGT